MKKKIVMAFILGIIVSSMTNVIASNTIPANSVIYEDTTVDVALDNLFDDVTVLEEGKNKIAEAITNNGLETNTTLSFEDMATNITTLATNKYNAGVTATKKGTATAAQVLTGYTFTNSSGVALSGTMANKGALNWKPTTSTTYTVPAGYYSGGTLDSSSVYTNGYNAGVTATKKGTVTAAQVLTGYTFTNSSGVAISGTMPNKGALNWKPTTSTTYTVPAGYYSGGTLDSSTVYTNGYNAGVTAADNRANTSSTNYKTGYNNGYNAGLSAGKTSGTPAITNAGRRMACTSGSRCIVITYGSIIQGASSTIATYYLGEDFGADWYAHLIVANGQTIVTSCEAGFVIQLGVS